MHRWSPRSFADRAVEPETIRSLLEAARWSASSRNLQPWSFIVAPREHPDDFERMIGCLMEGNIPWASKAPLLILTIAHLVIPGRDRTNGHAWNDLGLAVQNLCVQATALGLYVHQMGGFSSDKARTTFQIPEGYDPVTVLAVGYLGNPNELPEDRRDSELAPRERKPLSDFVFAGEWGQTSSLVDTQ